MIPKLNQLPDEPRITLKMRNVEQELTDNCTNFTHEKSNSHTQTNTHHTYIHSKHKNTPPIQICIRSSIIHT